HLERLHGGASLRITDLEMLESLSGNHASRESFLSDLTLDPPEAVGDLAGDPLIDEEYLILSTIHSAKGQEWDAVFILNVVAGGSGETGAGNYRDQTNVVKRAEIHVAAKESEMWT